MTNTKLPALRFPGFSDGWENKQLKDLSENGFCNGVFNDPSKVGKGYRLINVKDMFVGDKIDINNLTRVDISQKEFEKNKAEWGDIFFTRSSLVKEGIAISNINLNSDADLTFDGHLVRMRPKKKIIFPLFLAYFFKTKGARNQFITRGKTTTMTTIGQEDISTVSTNFPSLPEQQKIASFLTAIDAKIELLTKKKALLEQYKKGVMQQLFSQQIRFKDEEGNDFPEWEEKKLGEVVDTVTDYVASGSFESLRNNVNVYEEENFALYVRLTDLRHNLEHKDLKYVDEPSYKFLSKSNLFGGEILLANIGSNVGDTYLMPFINRKATIAPNMILLKENPRKFISAFLYYYLNTYEGRNNVNSVISGSGQPKINKTDLKKVIVKLPCIAEQKKISIFINTIDEKIRIVSMQVKSAQNYKKGLLQQLFV